MNIMILGGSGFVGSHLTRRLVIPLPDAPGRLQGRIFDLVPGKPFSSDNFKSLLLDSICSSNGFEALDIQPWTMREKASEWLDRNVRDRQLRYQRFRERFGRGKGA